MIILDPAANKHSVPVTVRQTTPDIWRCEYVSSTVGLHSVNVFFAGQSIPNSPFGVRISPGKFRNYCGIIILLNQNDFQYPIPKRYEQVVGVYNQLAFA